MKLSKPLSSNILPEARLQPLNIPKQCHYELGTNCSIAWAYKRLFIIKQSYCIPWYPWTHEYNIREIYLVHLQKSAYSLIISMLFKSPVKIILWDTRSFLAITPCKIKMHFIYLKHIIIHNIHLNHKMKEWGYSIEIMNKCKTKT